LLPQSPLESPELKRDGCSALPRGHPAGLPSPPEPPLAGAVWQRGGPRSDPLCCALARGVDRTEARRRGLGPAAGPPAMLPQSRGGGGGEPQEHQLSDPPTSGESDGGRLCLYSVATKTTVSLRKHTTLHLPASDTLYSVREALAEAQPQGPSKNVMVRPIKRGAPAH
jgi:hypothetical protein